MADFNDAADPELGAACNRLAAFCEALPADALVDEASGLTESDLGLILRRLYATRQDTLGEPGARAAEDRAAEERPAGRAGVPITARK